MKVYFSNFVENNPPTVRLTNSQFICVTWMTSSKLKSMREMSTTLEPFTLIIIWFDRNTMDTRNEYQISMVQGKRSKKWQQLCSTKIRTLTFEMILKQYQQRLDHILLLLVFTVHIQPFDSSFKSSTMLIFRCHHRCRCRLRRHRRRRHRTCHLHFIWVCLAYGLASEHEMLLDYHK